MTPLVIVDFNNNIRNSRHFFAKEYWHSSQYATEMRRYPAVPNNYLLFERPDLTPCSYSISFFCASVKYACSPPLSRHADPSANSFAAIAVFDRCNGSVFFSTPLSRHADPSANRFASIAVFDHCDSIVFTDNIGGLRYESSIIHHAGCRYSVFGWRMPALTEEPHCSM